MDGELVALQAEAELVLESEKLSQRTVHVVMEYLGAAASGFLGRVHRDVRVTHELVAVTRQSLGEVLRSLTRLEAIGLARASHGRYEPAGTLASADPVAA